jgi:membrane peptidoglycan carboxypeptidase
MSMSRGREHVGRSGSSSTAGGGLLVNRRSLTRMGLTATAAGVVLALLMFPLVGGLGLFAKSSADHFLDLPSDLVTPPLPQSSRILAADGTQIALLRGSTNRTVVNLADIPLVMRHAIVDIEDERFYQHGGVDLRGVARAALRNSEAGDVTQGGSTLTQQYVKNVLLQSARTPQERAQAAGTSLDRKLQEARYAVALEQNFSKDEILARYLNIAYFGDGAYGIGTAASHYFGKAVNDLTLPEAALLAGLVQSPSRYDPVRYPKVATDRRNTVLDRMRSVGDITAAQATAAEKSPLALKVTDQRSSDSCETSTAPFFCDYVRTQLLADPALGATADERTRRLYEGGLVIHTTLQPTVQAAAQNAVNSVVGTQTKDAAAEVIIEPGTGNILAMAVNRYYGSSTALNQTKVNLITKPVFQPGSTFKAFTLAAALEDGYGLNTAFYSPSCYTSTKFPVSRTGQSDCANGYSNSDPAESGVYNMSQGTWDSVNTYFIQLEEKVGVPAVVDMAERMGVPSARLADVSPSLGTLTIGAKVVSPLDMATAYATLAAHGLRCEPRYVNAATDSSGQTIDIATPPQCQQTLSAAVADTETTILEGVITKGTGYPNAAKIGRPAAGKTGTMDDFYSAWFVGYTPQMAAAVALGDPNGPTSNPLRNVVAAGRTWPEVFGGDIPAIIWGQSMHDALAGQPVMQFRPADPTTARGTRGGLLSTPPPTTAPPTGLPTGLLPSTGIGQPGGSSGPVGPGGPVVQAPGANTAPAA